jgi:hypothetical protein
MQLSPDQTILLKVTNDDLTGGTFNFPPSISRIGNRAFYDCSRLTSITIPQGVTWIGDMAFYGCDSLTSITLPQGVTWIGDDAFHSCSSLTSITLPQGVTRIGDKAFYGCDSLTSITLPQGVTRIGYKAFYCCRSLTSITLPQGVTSIGDAFCNYSSSIKIICPDDDYERLSQLLPMELRSNLICSSYNQVLEEELRELSRNSRLLTLQGSRFNVDILTHHLAEEYKGAFYTNDYYEISKRVRNLPVPSGTYSEAQSSVYRDSVRNLIHHELKSVNANACIEALKKYVTSAESQIPETYRQPNLFPSQRPENKRIIERLKTVENLIARLKEEKELTLSQEEAQLTQGQVFDILKRFEVLTQVSPEPPISTSLGN